MFCFPMLRTTRRRKAAKTAKKDKSKATSAELSTRAFLMSLLQQGFSRLFRDGEMIELQKPEDYPFDDFDNTFVLIDRLAAGGDIRQRLVDSLEICFREGHAAVIETTEGERLKFSDRSSANTTAPFTRSPSRIFSALIRHSARARRVRVLATRSASITVWSFRIRCSRSSEGAIEPFTRPQHAWAQKELLKYAAQHVDRHQRVRSPICPIISRTASSTATKAGAG